MQQAKVVFLASYELVMSFVFGLLTISLATWLLDRFVLSIPVSEFVKRRNGPGCLISGALVFAITYLARGSIEQSTLALQASISTGAGISLKSLAVAFGHFAVFYAISLTGSFALLYASSQAYRRVAPGGSIDVEIADRENMALAIFLTLMLAAVVVFVDKAMSHFLGSLVLYQNIQNL